MPQDAADVAAATPAFVPSLTETPPEFPADRRTLRLPTDDFVAGGARTLRFRLRNADDRSESGVLHVRLAPGAPWIARLLPTEAALGPGESQTVVVTVDADAGRRAVRSGASPTAPVRLLHQRLFSAEGNGGGGAGEREDAIYLHLPVALCPTCGKPLETAIAASGTEAIPEVCPFCFERLRPCPVCGAPNSWLARRCVLDSSHVLRAEPDWGTLGGGADHGGSRPDRAPVSGLARRWSYPNVAPARRENALAWSAPVAAYGMVAAAAATAEGDAHLYAFDARTGAPLWEPYPLPDPVYPDRGGAALAGGRLFAATVDGACVAVDALRGTRLWETTLPGRVYGAVVPTGEDGDGLLVAVAPPEGGKTGGWLVLLDGATGAIRWQTPLTGLPDAAPAFADGRAFVHDDGGTVTAIDAATGAVLWSARADGGDAVSFDAAPIIRDGRVISADSGGSVTARDAATGAEAWRLTVTSAPFGGTPATDGILVSLPADDGVHLVSAEAGRAVRRHPIRQPVRSAPVVVGGSLIFGATDGVVYGALPGRPLEKLYETGTIGSQIVAAPALADGTLFVAATNGVLYALTLLSPPPTESAAAAAAPEGPRRAR